MKLTGASGVCAPSKPLTQSTSTHIKVVPMQPARENWLTRLQKRYYAYVEREDTALFERLKHDPSLQPRLTSAKVAVFAIAIAIHSVTILLPILAVVVFVTQFA